MHAPLPLRALLAALLVAAPGLLPAQCPGCIIDNTCTVSPAYPTLCPMQPPDATAGVYYESDITFWLPPTFTDPGTGFTVSFQQMTITSVSGLPFGLALTPNNPSGIYYPQQSQYGCARICGTPLGAGSFPITISIIASVVFNGINIDAPQQFVITLNVLPGSGGNNSFTYSPTSGCGSVTATFQALIDASPQPTSWAWDFGNGNTSTSPAPPPQTYAQPGTYSVSLTTVISAYVLNSVTLTGVNGNWCGDIEEPFCNCGTPIIGTCPDLYFTLNGPAGTVYTSGTIDGVTSANWNLPGIILDNPPYTITFWDEDPVSNDDNLGTYAINLVPGGSYSFNLAGGTNGSLNIVLTPQQQFFDEAEVVVHPLPDVVLQEAGTQLCVDDPSLSGFTWLLNGELVPGLGGPCITPTGIGLWSVLATNGFGCSDTSNTVTVCPVMAINRSGNQLIASPGYSDYSWTYNGAPIPGANGPVITTIGDGTYTVTALGPYNCVLTATYELNTIGIGEEAGTMATLGLFPNPSDGAFTIRGEGLAGPWALLRILDGLGRTVHERQHTLVGGMLYTDLRLDLQPGNYLVQVQHGSEPVVLRLVIE